MYILQILQLIHSYTTTDTKGVYLIQLCISFKFCNWYIPIQLFLLVFTLSYSCVYPSNFAIDTFLYNVRRRCLALLAVVYILQILQLIHSYTTCVGFWKSFRKLCISFKFCNWYIPIQLNLFSWERSNVVYILQILQLIHSYTTVLRSENHLVSCVYPSNFAIDTFLYNFEI